MAEELKFENENEDLDITCPITMLPFSEEDAYLPMVISPCAHTVGKAALLQLQKTKGKLTCPCCQTPSIGFALNVAVLDFVKALDGSLKISQDLRDKNQHLEAQNAAYKETLEDTFGETGRSERLQAALETATKKTTALQAQISAAQEEPKRLHQILNEQAKRLQSEHQEYKKLKEESTRKDTALEELTAKLAAAEAENQKLKAEKKKSKKERQKMQKAEAAEKAADKAEIKKLEMECATANVKVQATENKLNAVKGDLTKRIKELEKEVDAGRKTITKLTTKQTQPIQPSQASSSASNHAASQPSNAAQLPSSATESKAAEITEEDTFDLGCKLLKATHQGEEAIFRNSFLKTFSKDDSQVGVKKYRELLAETKGLIEILSRYKALYTNILTKAEEELAQLIPQPTAIENRDNNAPPPPKSKIKKHPLITIRPDPKYNEFINLLASIINAIAAGDEEAAQKYLAEASIENLEKLARLNTPEGLSLVKVRDPEKIQFIKQTAVYAIHELNQRYQEDRGVARDTARANLYKKATDGGLTAAGKKQFYKTTMHNVEADAKKNLPTNNVDKAVIPEEKKDETPHSTAGIYPSYVDKPTHEELTQLLESTLNGDNKHACHSYIAKIKELVDKNQTPLEQFFKAACDHAKEICLKHNLEGERIYFYKNQLGKEYLDSFLRSPLEEGIMNDLQNKQTFGQSKIDQIKTLYLEGFIDPKEKLDAINDVVKIYCQKGEHYEKSDSNQDKRLAVEFYECAKSYGSRGGRYHLARCYADGIGVDKDPDEAIRILEEIQKKQPEAQALLDKLIVTKKASLPTQAGAAMPTLAPSNASRASNPPPAEDSKNGSKGEDEAEQLITSLRASLAKGAIQEINRLLTQANVPALENLTRLLKAKEKKAGDNLESIHANLDSTLLDLTWYELGLRYEEGRGIPCDGKKAVKYFSMVEGDIAAQVRIGICYLMGNGMEKDEASARKFLKLAADKKHPQAQFLLGSSYFDSKASSPEEVDQGKALIKAAAQQKDPIAQSRMVAFYLEDIGLNITLTQDQKKRLVDLTTNFAKTAKALYILADECITGFNPLTQDVPANALKIAYLYKLALIHGAHEAKQPLQAHYNHAVGIDPSLQNAVANGNESGIKAYITHTCDQLGIAEKDAKLVLDDALNQINALRSTRLVTIEQARRASQILELEVTRLFPSAPGEPSLLARKKPISTSSPQPKSDGGDDPSLLGSFLPAGGI